LQKQEQQQVEVFANENKNVLHRLGGLSEANVACISA
jgi:hypothetical protein